MSFLNMFGKKLSNIPPPPPLDPKRKKLSLLQELQKRKNRENIIPHITRDHVNAYYDLSIEQNPLYETILKDVEPYILEADKEFEKKNLQFVKNMATLYGINVNFNDIPNTPVVSNAEIEAELQAMLNGKAGGSRFQYGGVTKQELAQKMIEMQQALVELQKARDFRLAALQRIRAEITDPEKQQRMKIALEAKVQAAKAKFDGLTQEVQSMTAALQPPAQTVVATPAPAEKKSFFASMFGKGGRRRTYKKRGGRKTRRSHSRKH